MLRGMETAEGNRGRAVIHTALIKKAVVVTFQSLSGTLWYMHITAETDPRDSLEDPQSK